MNEPASTDEDRTPCDYCGAPVPDLCFGVETSRPVPTADGRAAQYAHDWQNFVFCNQEHAALWMQTPLPALDPLAPGEDGRSGPAWRDRASAFLVGAGLVVAIGLFLLGLFTAIRWLIEL